MTTTGFKNAKPYVIAIATGLIASMLYSVGQNIWDYFNPNKSIVISELKCISVVSEEYVSDITITYNGEILKNIFIYEYEIRQIGRGVINTSDFSIPITIQFPSKVSHIDLIESNDLNLMSELSEKIRSEDKTVYIPPIILNHNDYFLIQCVIEVDKNSNVDISSVKFNGRIAGTNITRKVNVLKIKSIMNVAVLICCFSNFILCFFVAMVKIISKSTNLNTRAIIHICVGIFLAIWMAYAAFNALMWHLNSTTLSY